MAKKRRVARQVDSPPQTGQPKAVETDVVRDSPFGSLFQKSGPVHPRSIAAMMLGGLFVYAGYFPSDSVAVEQGDALWFSTACIVLAALTLTHWFWAGSNETSRTSIAIDVLALGLGGWMMVAAFGSSPPGNLREATNEAWFWIAGAAVFVALRRTMSEVSTQRAALGLILVCTVCLAVHGLHQQFVSLPQLRAEYRADPDQTLKKAGVLAPEGSAERMVFESRLYDGGPSATFALANSVAGALVAGLAIAVAMLRFSWVKLGWSRRFCSLLCAAILFVGLYYLRSRSATLAALIAIVVAFVLAAINARERERSGVLRLLVLAASIGVGLAALIGLGLAVFANAEWIEEAPESLSFRLQYWQTTFAMTLDRPLFGAGPGNFQSIYDQYRAASANEQIAEPHNFLFETLGAGGFIAAALLLGLVFSLARFVIGSKPECGTAGDSNETDRSFWIWTGSGIVLAGTWLLGLAIGNMPDFSAHVFALPVAIIFGTVLWPAVRELDRSQTRVVAQVGLLGMMIHLCASGGWTIPGVTIVLLTLVSVIASVENESRSGEPVARSKAMALGVLFLGTMLFVSIRWMSVTPVAKAAVEMGAAQFYGEQGSRGQSEAALDRAIVADSWSPKAALWRADMLHWDLVRGGESASRRDSWNEKLELALSRGGQDPPLMEVVGLQQLHLYQRFGKQEDLLAARQSFSRVVQWSGSDQKSTAQLAVILEQLGETAEAQKLAKRAEELSKIGDNLERSLTRQLIYPAKHFGLSAAEAPIQDSASRLLANLLR